MVKSDKNSRHQLVAILFADIVGFTELSTQDEKKTLKLVERFENASKSAIVYGWYGRC